MHLLQLEELENRTPEVQNHQANDLLPQQLEFHLPSDCSAFQVLNQKAAIISL